MFTFVRNSCLLFVISGLCLIGARAQDSSSSSGQSPKPQQSEPKPEDASKPSQTPSAPPPQAESAPGEQHAAPSEQKTEEPTSKSSEPAAAKPVLSGQELTKFAWASVRDGISDKSPMRRAAAVKSLSLLKGENRAVSAASNALDDKSVEVRSAAALALGEVHATSAIPKLKAALSDKEPRVVLAAAHSLVQMKDPNGYEIYYAIVTGQRKGSKGLIAGELDTFKDPKKLALLGFEQGIGYVPFGSIGYTAVKTMVKDEGAPGRAAAVRALQDDPDSATGAALSDAAVGDKSELVRVTALETLARRDDPSVIGDITPCMYDDKDSVKFTAATAVLHLSDVKEQRSRPKKSTKSRKKTK